MVTVTATTIHRVLANCPEGAMIPAYVGPDEASARAAYAAEAHAYYAVQTGSFGPAPDYAPQSVTTIASAFK